MYAVFRPLQTTLILLQTNATPIQRTTHLEATTESTPFSAAIRLQHQRLLNVTHSTDAWLRRQRNRADSLVSIIARTVLTKFTSATGLVDALRAEGDRRLRADDFFDECPALSAPERAERLEWINANATAISQQLTACAALAHDDLARLIKQQFYDYYRDLQTQSLSAKHAVLLPFEIYNPVTQQAEVAGLLEELVDSVDASMAEYLRPDVERELGAVAERGALVVDMAASCAYDLVVYLSEMVHVALAEC